MRRDLETIALTFAAICVMILCALLVAGIVRGQAPSPENEQQLTVARALVGEGGWSERDHIAIRYALHAQARAAGTTEADAALAYCAALKPPWTARKRWVRALRGDLTEPAHWPATASWRAHAPRWRRVLELAAKPAKRPRFCRRAPYHWGARDIGADVRRMSAALAAGRWRDAECEGTRNAFAAVMR